MTNPLDRIAADACGMSRPAAVNEDATARRVEAIRRFRAGERYGTSTNIAEQTTYGYGELDYYGYWEFQIPSDMVESARKANP